MLFRLRFDLNAVVLVAGGALAAATGRFVLATVCGRARDRFSAERRASLEALAGYLERRRAASAIGLGLFALSPVPSAQLFEAAGLTGMKLGRLTLAFFAGRLVSYSIYVGGASALDETDFGELVQDSMTSPVGVGLQLLFLAGVIAVGRIDWRRPLAGR